jgi:hypothetical protein
MILATVAEKRSNPLPSDAKRGPRAHPSHALIPSDDSDGIAPRGRSNGLR